MPDLPELASLRTMLSHPDVVVVRQGLELLRALNPTAPVPVSHLQFDRTERRALSVHKLAFEASWFSCSEFFAVHLTDCAIQQPDTFYSCLFHDCQWDRVAIQGHLVSPRFYSCAWEAVDVTDSTIETPSWAGCTIDGGQFRNVLLQNATFLSTTLTEAPFPDSMLYEAVLNGVVAKGSAFSGAVWERVRLLRSDLSAADCAAISGEVVLYDSSTRWPSGFDPRSHWSCLADGGDVSGANLDRMSLSAVSAESANLARASLQLADLSGARLRGASLRGADLANARLQGADLTGADLRDANLKTADLRGACLQGADLRGARLLFTKLQGADMSGARTDAGALQDALR